MEAILGHFRLSTSGSTPHCQTQLSLVSAVLNLLQLNANANAKSLLMYLHSVTTEDDERHLKLRDVEK